MKQPFKALVKLYKWYCILLGSYVALVLAISMISYQFGTVYFPNGAYLHRKSMFSGDQEILLWHRDGYPLSDSGVSIVCYNDRFVRIWSTDLSQLIYKEDAPQAVFSNDLQFDGLIDRSGLSPGKEDCADHWSDYLTGGSLMFHNSQLVAFAPEKRRRSGPPDRKSGTVKP